MSKVRDLHERWSRAPDYRAAYEALGPEFELARSLIEAHALPPGYRSTSCREGESAGGEKQARAAARPPSPIP